MPGKNKFTYLLVITTYLLLSVGMSFSYAQDKKEKIKFRNRKDKQVSADERLQAEYLFTEAIKNSITEDYPRALSYLQKSLEMDPSNDAAFYKMAEILFKTGKLQQAEKSIQMALSLKDQNKYYYILAADIQTQQGNFPAAAGFYETMLQKTDAGTQHILELAVLYLRMNDYEKAIQAYDKAEKVLGINEQIIIQKQKLYLEQNKLSAAIKEGEKLVENFPKEPSYVIQQAELLLNNQQPSEALLYLQNYLKDNPGQPQAHYMLAKIHQQQGNHPAAAENLKQAFLSPALDINVKVQEIAALLAMLPNDKIQQTVDSLTMAITNTHPENALAYVSRGDFLFTIKEHQEARRTYLKALELDPNHYNVWQNSLSIGLDLGRYDSVAKEADQALELFPNQPFIYYCSGAANLSLKSYDEAVFALEQGKKLAAANQELTGVFNSHLGDAYNGLRNYPKSDAAYEAALQASPENDYILNNYSYYLSLRREKLNLAKEMSEKLVKKHPENPTYLDTHAWVLYQLKQYREAKDYLERALLHKGSEDGTIVEHYGDVLFKLNQKDEALKQWQKARDLPNSSDLLDKKIKDRKLYE